MALGTQISVGLYAGTAFQLAINTLQLLQDKGAISAAERSDLLNTIANGMRPADDPQIQAMRDFLLSLSVRPS